MKKSQDTIKKSKLKRGTSSIKRHKSNIKMETNLLKKYPKKRIAELSNVIAGVKLKSYKKNIGRGLLYLGYKNIEDGKIRQTNNDRFVKLKDIPEPYKKAILQKGDLLLKRTPSSKDQVYLHDNDDVKAIIGPQFFILQSAIPNYLKTFLISETGVEYLRRAVRFRTKHLKTIPQITIQNVENIKIPILPIEDLEIISDEKLGKLETDSIHELKSQIENQRLELEELKEINADLVKSHISMNEKLLDIVGSYSSENKARKKHVSSSNDIGNSSQSINIEELIKLITISYENDTQISVQQKGKKETPVTAQSLGFSRPSGITWQNFLKVLRHPPKHYWRCKADRDRKQLSEVNKKLKSWIEKNINFDFPPKYKIYQRVETEAPGTYSFNFKIVFSDIISADQSSKDTFLKKWEITLENWEKTNDPTLEKELFELANTGLSKHFLTPEQIAEDLKASNSDYKETVFDDLTITKDP